MYLLKNIENYRSVEIGLYEKHGGYSALRKAYSMKPEEILKEVENAPLRGRGGAGYPSGMKWSIAASTESNLRVLVCNADEGEPGTFKDRKMLEYKPHLIIEGIVIAARAIGAELAFIYLRNEYPRAMRNIIFAITEAEKRGYIGQNILGSKESLILKVHRGAGAYICGEETALLESLEGKRGHPRLKPPYPAVEGFMGLPTVVNNVETLCNVPLIISIGAKAYSEIGTPGSPGPKLFSVSGHVKKPGVYELPMGVTLRELIFEHAGGIRGDKKIKGVIPGGVSTAVMTPDKLDCPLDFNSMKAYGSSLGTGAVIVLDESTCMAKVALRIAAFFEHESCGKCSPCREGTGWLRAIFERIEHGEGRQGDLELINEVADNISSTSFCALGDVAATSAKSYISNYKDEFEAHIAQRCCDVSTVSAT
jgi:NADH-quinone oxidoreductase subunit F